MFQERHNPGRLELTIIQPPRIYCYETQKDLDYVSAIIRLDDFVIGSRTLRNFVSTVTVLFLAGLLHVLGDGLFVWMLSRWTWGTEKRLCSRITASASFAAWP